MPALIQPAESKSSDDGEGKSSKYELPKLFERNQENHIANTSRPREVE